MESPKSKYNEFYWINILTPSLTNSRAFFSDLLSWKYVSKFGVDTCIEVDGQPFGAMFDLTHHKTPPGTTPSLTLCFLVEDANEAAQKVRSLGGEASDVKSVENGFLVVCQDPNSAKFDLWQAKKDALQSNAKRDGSIHGMPSWFETMTSKAKPAADFYCNLFDWQQTEQVMDDGSSYTVFTHNDESHAGLMEIRPDMGGMKPNWSAYFTVDNVDESAVKAQKMGAQLLMPPMNIPDIGRFSTILSPQGIPFNVITYLPRSAS